MRDCRKSQREFEALVAKVAALPTQFKKANQVIDVRFFQARKRGEWKARIDMGKERHYIGPASIAAVLANVSNFIRGESAYTDARVHGVDNDLKD